MKFILGLLASLFLVAPVQAQNNGPIANHAFAVGKGPNVSGYTSVLCTAGKVPIGQSSADPQCQTISGDGAISAAGVLTLATVNGNVGSFGSTTQCVTLTVNAKGLITAASAATCVPAVGSITGLGAGVATALAIAIGSAGAPVVFNGAGGTPSSLVLTNATALPLGGSGVTGTLPFARGGTNDTGTAATTYTPTAVCSGGGTLTAAVLTNAGRFKQIAGKFYWLKIDVVLTTIGTCIGNIDYSLPTGITGVVQGNQIVMGREFINTGKSMQGRMLNSATTIRAAYFDNTFALVNGDEHVLEGIVEIQ